jgi:hypothetical protein
MPERPGQAVAGIGVSAGGLDAFKKFFAAMPPDGGIAFVLVPHLDPARESLMVELLARHTAMPVAEATVECRREGDVLCRTFPLAIAVPPCPFENNCCRASWETHLTIARHPTRL